MVKAIFRKNWFCALVVLATCFLFPAPLVADDDSADADTSYTSDDSGPSDDEVGELEDFYSGTIDMGDNAYHNPQDDVEDWFEYYGLREELGNEGADLVNNVLAAEAALEAAREAGLDDAELESLQQAVDEAQAALDSFCEEHGWSYTRDDDVFTLFDSLGEVAKTVGDPVLLASGIFQIDDNDIQIAVGKARFTLGRHYTSDVVSAGGGTDGALGYGWSSVLDSRIILGTIVFQADDVLASWDERIEKTERTAEAIAAYAEEDPACAVYAEEIQALLAERTARRDALKRMVQKSAEHTEKNRFSGYGFAGDKAKTLGCDRLILVDDSGNPLVFVADGNEYQATSVAVRSKMTLSYDTDADTYTVRFAGGETRTYDGFGLLSAISFAYGGRIVFTRNADHNIASVSVNDARSLHFTWNGNHLATVTDGVRTISYAYEGARLVSVRDDEGDTKSFAYDEKGRIIRQIKADGSFVAFGYETQSDGKDRTVYTINENGAKETFSYDIPNRRTTYTDHDGVTSWYEYDEHGHTLKETYADGKSIAYAYDANGNLTLRDSMGERVTCQYDEQNRRILAQYGDGSTERWSYTGDNVRSYTDRDGVTTAFDYDARGNMTALYRGGQLVSAYEYNDWGQVTRETDCCGNKTEWVYDAQGNCVQKKRFSDGTPIGSEQWAYDAIGRVIRYDDARGISYTYQYAPHRMLLRASNGYEAEFIANNRKDMVTRREKDTQSGEERIFQYEYDKSHHLTRIMLSGTDGNGNYHEAAPFQTVTYTSHGRLAGRIIWDAAENIAYAYDFDQAGNISAIGYGAADTNGALEATASQIRYERDWETDGFSVSELLGDGRTMVRRYDTWGRLLSERDGKAIRAQNSFSAGGRLLAARTASGGMLEFSYDAATGFYAGEAERDGTLGRSEVTCYADGKEAVLTNPAGDKTYSFYDAFGLLSKVISDGKTEQWTRDGAGRITAHTILSSSGKVVYEEQWEYSADGRSVTATAGGRYKTTFRSNAFGEVVGITDGAGNKRGFVYDIRGRCIESVDAYGKKARFFYDGKNQLVQAIDRNGNATAYAYDVDGNCIRVTNASGVVFAATYDQSGRVLSKTQQPSPVTEYYEYDGNDRITRIRRGDTVILQTIFATDGKGITRLDANGKASVYKTDGFGRILAERNRLGAEQHFAFRQDGSLRESADFAGDKTAYRYDRAERTTTVTYSDGAFAVETRDEAGNIIHAKNQSESVRFTYDTGGKMLSQYDERTGATVTYTYDACGRRTRALSEKQDVRYQYGKNSELIKITDELNKISVQFAYDAEGNEVLRAHATGESAESFYDAAGRLILTVGYAPNRSVIFAEGTVYGDHGERTLVLNSDLSVTRYRYDADGRLSSVQYAYRDDIVAHLKNLCAEAGLQYNESGTALAEAHHFSAAEYSALKSLCAKIGFGLFQPQTTGATITESFAYDKNGNLISRKTPFGTILYHYDADDRLISWGDNGTASYDANGNLVARKNLYKSEFYAYNKNNRMERATIQSTVDAEIYEYACQYDAFGRRTVVSSSESGALRTVYDGLTFNDLYATRDHADIAVQTAADSWTSQNFRYTWISDVADERTRTVATKSSATRAAETNGGYVSLYGNSRTPIAVTHLAGTAADRYALFSDMAGTVRATYAADGAQNQYAYDAFGAKTTAGAGGIPYGFAGKKSLGATNLYDFGYRDYAADAFRFTTLDPARDGLNWYVYCNGDSVNYVDLLGLIVARPQDVDMQDERWGYDVLGNKIQTENIVREAILHFDPKDAESAQVYKNIMKGYGVETIATAGCVVSGLSQIINELLGLDLTPKDINDNKTNFRNGSDLINFVAVAQNYGLEHDYWTAAKQSTSGLEAKINELDEALEVYCILAEVYYADGHTHWVGVDGKVEKLSDGKNYIAISKTSQNDSSVGEKSLRNGQGWKEENGKIYVPTSKIKTLHQFSVPDEKNK